MHLRVMDNLLGNLHHAENHPSGVEHFLPICERLACKQGLKNSHQCLGVMNPRLAIDKAWILQQFRQIDGFDESRPSLLLRSDQQEPATITGAIRVEQRVWGRLTIVLTEEFCTMQ